MGIYKDRIVKHIDAVRGVVFKAKMSKNEKLLAEVFLWQEIARIADENLKSAWKNAQIEFINNDDELRLLGKGDHIAAEAGNLSCDVKVSNGRYYPDVEAFIKAIVETYKAPLGGVVALAEKSKKEGNPSLSKRILEAL